MGRGNPLGYDMREQLRVMGMELLTLSLPENFLYNLLVSARRPASPVYESTLLITSKSFSATFSSAVAYADERRITLLQVKSIARPPKHGHFAKTPGTLP
jgi:hypothetical protein